MDELFSKRNIIFLLSIAAISIFTWSSSAVNKEDESRQGSAQPIQQRSGFKADVKTEGTEAKSGETEDDGPDANAGIFLPFVVGEKGSAAPNESATSTPNVVSTATSMPATVATTMPATATQQPATVTPEGTLVEQPVVTSTAVSTRVADGTAQPAATSPVVSTPVVSTPVVSTPVVSTPVAGETAESPTTEPTTEPTAIASDTTPTVQPDATSDATATVTPTTESNSAGIATPTTEATAGPITSTPRPTSGTITSGTITSTPRPTAGTVTSGTVTSGTVTSTPRPTAGSTTPTATSEPTSTPTSTPTSPPTSTPSPTPTEAVVTPLATVVVVDTATPTPSPTSTPQRGLNLALEKGATQSSTGWNRPPSLAVDGRLDGAFTNGSVTASSLEAEPWWQVDLGSDRAAPTFDIEQIVLHNRTDCCGSRLQDFHVFVSNQDMSSNSLAELKADSSIWQTHVADPVDGSLEIDVNQSGRFVKVHLEGTQTILSLAEVQVFGQQPMGLGNVLQIGRVSEEAIAVESTGQSAQYIIQRFGDLGAATYNFEVTGDLEAQAVGPATRFLMAAGRLDMSPTTPAESGDYVVKTEADVILGNSISFADGQTEQIIKIEAISDDQIEVAEMLNLDLVPQPDVTYQYLNAINVILADNPPGINDGSILLIGQFRPEGGALTSASGYVTVRLSGDNEYALVNVSFSGLTSEQTAAHIHIGNPDSGPIIESLPMGQIADYEWTIRASQFIGTDQEMLDTLLSGGLYVNVHSNEYPSGEIRATLYQPTTGPTFNYTTPAYEVLTGDELRQDIFRFLSQATFGPTPELVADLEQRVNNLGGDRIAAYDQWISEQLTMEAPSHLDYYHAARVGYGHGLEDAGELQSSTYHWMSFTHGRIAGWFLGPFYAKAQLRERTAFALSEIMVAAPINVHISAAAPSYNDMLKTHAFDDLDVLLYHVSRHPLMGTWLSYFQNQKTTRDENGRIIASPDENYAREIMQLFSIGLLELHPDGTLKINEEGLPVETYTQDDITELARIFTGWGRRDAFINPTPHISVRPPMEENFLPFNHRYSGYSSVWHRYYSLDQTTPMKQFDEYHDFESKNVLGYHFPAGQGGEQELLQVVNILTEHPNSGPFIAYRLMQRLTTSNPSPAYIYRVTQAYEESGHNLGEMIRAILLDPEIRNLQPVQTAGAGRVREPLVQYVTLCRLLHCGNVNQDGVYSMANLTNFGFPAEQLDLYEADAARFFIYGGYLGTKGASISQVPLAAPSVFNWFSPDFAPSGSIAAAGLTAPEMQYITESKAFDFYGAMWATIYENPWVTPAHLTNSESTQVLRKLPQPMIDAYMAVMDSDQNGVIEPADAAFSDPAKVREVSAALIDIVDLYLCGGWLASDATGDPLTDPREILITGVIDTQKHLDNIDAAKAATARDTRIQEALFLGMVVPQCNVQR